MCLESRSEINGRIKTDGRRRYLKEESGRSTYIVVTVDTCLCENILINLITITINIFQQK